MRKSTNDDYFAICETNVDLTMRHLEAASLNNTDLTSLDKLVLDKIPLASTVTFQSSPVQLEQEIFFASSALSSSWPQISRHPAADCH